MDAVPLEQFKRALQGQHKTVVYDLGENRDIIAVERSADELDQTGRAAEQEFAILGLNRRSELLRNIQAALRRIDDRTFGTCTNCEEAIGWNRLTAIPWTPLCIRCQELEDTGDTRTIELAYQLDGDAG